MSIADSTPSRLTFTAPLLLVTAAAWIGVFAIAHDMGAMPGTMGLGVIPFVAMWALMMAAMMLPSIVPFASLYVSTFGDDRGWRLAALSGGYLIVWTLPAFPAYAFAWWMERASVTNPFVLPAVAVAALTACGIYQLTPLKHQCLKRCRSPLSDAFKYAAFKGRARELRVGVSHGLNCLGCCWALMALMLSFGLMNVTAMVGLTAVCLIEKVWAWGPQFARAVGVAALVVAVVVALYPDLAPWLHQFPICKQAARSLTIERYRSPGLLRPRPSAFQSKSGQISAPTVMAA